jgi:hypothetical protein
MIDMYHNVLIKPYYEGQTWNFLINKSVPETGFTFEYPEHLDIDNRGALYYAITTSVKRVGDPGKLPETAYITNTFDSDKIQLNGSNTYKMRVPADVPVDYFWSATVYDLTSAAWIKGAPKLSVSSKTGEMVYNKDDSADIYFGPKAPKGKEANWVYTEQGEEFFVIFRFYGSQKAVFTKSWKLEPIVKIN